MFRSHAFGVAAAAAVLTSAAPAWATKHISTDVKIPARLVTQVSTPDGCRNQGPTIELGGTLYTAPLAAAVMLSNNLRRTHTAGPYDAVAQFTLSDFGQTTFAKQGSLPYGVGGNPWIAVAESAYADPTIIGRCVQGLDGEAVSEFLLDAHLEADVSSGGCDQQGPTVEITGTLTVGGAQVTVFLQNKRTEPTHWASTDAVLGLEVTPGSAISVAKSPHFGGAGGNPIVFVQIGESVWNLGRCNKL